MRDHPRRRHKVIEFGRLFKWLKNGDCKSPTLRGYDCSNQSAPTSYLFIENNLLVYILILKC